MDAKDQLKLQAEQIDQMLHRRADLITLREDRERDIKALVIEEAELAGAVAVARRRVDALKQEIASAPVAAPLPAAKPALVPADVTEQKLAAAAEAAKKLPAAIAEKKS